MLRNIAVLKLQYIKKLKVGMVKNMHVLCEHVDLCDYGVIRAWRQ